MKCYSWNRKEHSRAECKAMNVVRNICGLDGKLLHGMKAVYIDVRVSVKIKTDG